MVKQRTLALIKPHMFKNINSFGKAIVGAIVDIQSRYLALGMKIVAIKSFAITEEFLREFYHEHVNKPFFERDLVPAMEGGLCIAMVLEDEDAVQKVRAVNGATNPAEAFPGTIRHLYGIHEKGPNNAVHGSDSPESAEREIKIFNFI
ncbi:nucleoside-diphosphate kinase [Patescibacteria group bacterium]|nr:nucleoside-diphosphate kinase [Candidatus Falkowbacteria bacterium]MBU3906436.1 nucleoside-diphosphate kinase [Patescibacteria group bacterium]MBU4015491.1 nucleoside-diphosphate kinase [Patescibacteria group bacterium]MBU4026398.1 nucleoside-diphosphate kinase [Patescibacteria group bacterium]MBU4073738.1 nucleoside-diphosphate kinase [Patescibacteria group bacterium]